jgi:hypothetical protein
MAITAALCNSYKQEILQGVHEAADTYKIALYTSSATLSKSTTAYSGTNEVANGNGYTTGGATLSGFSTSLDGDVAILDFTTDPEWSNATITAAGALIYNSSQSDKAVAVLSFGGDITSTAGTFKVTFPAAAAATGLIRLEAPA